MQKIQLTRTHQRILANFLFVLEQKAGSIEQMIKCKSNHASYTVVKDLSEREISRLVDLCSLLKEKISGMYNDIELKKRTVDQYQYVNTIQSQMWELVSDAFSDKLKGYGDHLRSNAKIIDPYIDELSQIINELKILNNSDP